MTPEREAEIRAWKPWGAWESHAIVDLLAALDAARADAADLAEALDSGVHWGCTCPWDKEGNPSGFGGDHSPYCCMGEPIAGAEALAVHRALVGGDQK